MFVKSDKAVLINLIAFNSKLLLFTLSRLQNEGHMETKGFRVGIYHSNTRGTVRFPQDDTTAQDIGGIRQVQSLFVAGEFYEDWNRCQQSYLCRCSSGFPSN